MLLYHALLLFAIISACCSLYCPHCNEAPIKPLENESFIVEVDEFDDIDEDNNILLKTIPLQGRDIKSIVQQGLAASESLYHDFIDGDLGILKYKLNDTYIKGVNLCKVVKTEIGGGIHTYRMCVYGKRYCLTPDRLFARLPIYDIEKTELDVVKVDKDISSFIVNLNCPYIKIAGLYSVTGVLITMPIEGDGDYNVEAEDYYVTVNTSFKKLKGKDDKMHLKFKTFSLQAQARGKVTYQINNLFNGNKKLSDAVNNFANSNWKLVSDFGQDPIWYASVKKILKNVNKYLKPVPLDEVKFD